MEDFASYRWFVDALVDLAKGDVSATRIRQNGHAERTNEMQLSDKEQLRMELVQALNPTQQQMLADMFDECRSAAVHDMACFLEEELSVKGLEISKDGNAIPESPYATMHYDFVCRMEGDPWPETET